MEWFGTEVKKSINEKNRYKWETYKKDAPLYYQIIFVKKYLSKRSVVTHLEYSLSKKRMEIAYKKRVKWFIKKELN